eukprot:jgi/Mesen1/1526/ME001323S00376
MPSWEGKQLQTFSWTLLRPAGGPEQGWQLQGGAGAGLAIGNAGVVGDASADTTHQQLAEGPAVAWPCRQHASSNAHMSPLPAKCRPDKTAETGVERPADGALL